MARRILDAVGRALTRTDFSADHQHPHFHRGAQGNVAARFVHGCNRPKLDS